MNAFRTIGESFSIYHCETQMYVVMTLVTRLVGESNRVGEK